MSLDHGLHGPPCNPWLDLSFAASTESLGGVARQEVCADTMRR